MKRIICRLACLGLLCMPLLVLADSARYRITNIPEPYIEECAGCHIAYPPGLLSARTWQNVMADLDQHYGTDVTLEPDLKRLLDVWLRDNAGQGRRHSAIPPEDRITKADWYLRKHRKIDKSVWRVESVKSAANCEACHAKAEEGYFDKRDLTVPEGLNNAQMRAFAKSGGKYGKDRQNRKYRD